MIQTSEQTDKIGPAFLKAQMEIESVKKNSKNPAFKRADGSASRYANLADVQEAIKGPLNEAGLFLLHPLVTTNQPDYVACQVYLGHAESGQFLTSVYEMKVDRLTPQGYLAAGTYCQRGAVVSFFALEQEDDDGNTASGQKVATTTARPTAQATNNGAKTTETTPKVIDKTPGRQITEEERAKLNNMRGQLEMPAFSDAMTYSEYLTAGAALHAKIQALVKT